MEGVCSRARSCGGTYVERVSCRGGTCSAPLTTHPLGMWRGSCRGIHAGGMQRGLHRGVHGGGMQRDIPGGGTNGRGYMEGVCRALCRGVMQKGFTQSFINNGGGMWRGNVGKV